MTIHHSTSDSLNQPFPLSRDLVEQYRTEGHLLLRNVAPREEINAFRPILRQVVDAIAQKNERQGRIEDYNTLFRQVTNVWQIDERLRSLVFASRFARIAAELMGVSRVRLYHDQALFKPAGGKPTPWHQDQFYWPLDTVNTITMWMPLLDLTEDMGTMLFAAGSHRDGPFLNQSISEESGILYERLVSEKKYPVRSYSLNAGDATFHAGWTVHAAHPNTSAKIREVLTVIYYEDGAHIMEPDSDFRKVDMEVFHPGAKPGDLAATPLNPILYPPPFGS